MHKTSVYLTSDEADALREAAAATGIAQSALIREGVRHVVAAHSERARIFHSMGRGRSGGVGSRRWSAAELREKTRGQR